MCLLADLTLMLAWTPEEAGKIVETYKLFENKPPDLIMARAQQYPHQKVSQTNKRVAIIAYFNLKLRETQSFINLYLLNNV